jgi:hypothetical protein
MSSNHACPVKRITPVFIAYSEKVARCMCS